MKKILYFIITIIVLSGCSFEKANLAGTLKNMYGQPVADANIVIHSEVAETKSGSDGKFKFENIEKGHHQLYAYKPGYFMCKEIEIDNIVTQVDPVMYPGFFSKQKKDKIFMLDRNSGMVNIDGEMRPTIKIYNYDSNSKNITLEASDVYVPSFDKQITGDTGLVEAGGYIWAASIVPAKDKVYLHRFSYDLALEQSFTFSNQHQYSSSRFLIEKDGYIIQDDINFISKDTNFEVGLRIYKINNGVPLLVGEYIKNLPKVYIGCAMMDFTLNGNIIELLVYWHNSSFTIYKFDISEIENPVYIE